MGIPAPPLGSARVCLSVCAQMQVCVCVEVLQEAKKNQQKKGSVSFFFIRDLERGLTS